MPERVWYTTHPKPNSCSDPCSSGQYGAVTAIPGAVFAGERGGTLRAYSTGDGEVLWEYNTMQEYETVNGVRAKGGVDLWSRPGDRRGYALHGLWIQHHHGRPGQRAVRLWRRVTSRVSREGVRQDLQRDIAAELGVGSAIDSLEASRSGHS